jgi:hypothetical protein
MVLLDTVIFYLFKETIYGYGIVGYGVYQITKRLLPNKPKLPTILTLIAIVFSFWYLPTLPIKHWRSGLNMDIEKYKNFSIVTDNRSEIIFLTPVEMIHGWGDKDHHLIESVTFKYPFKTPQNRKLFDVDCKENTLETSILKDKGYNPELSKLNSFGKEVVDGLYYTPTNSLSKMSPIVSKMYCDFDWSEKKENILKEMRKS